MGGVSAGPSEALSSDVLGPARPAQAALNSCSGPQSLDPDQRQRLGHRGERSRDNNNAVSSYTDSVTKQVMLRRQRDPTL